MPDAGFVVLRSKLEPDVIAVAYGTAKIDAVEAGIRGGYINSVVTHTAMASGLLRAT